MPTFQGTEIFSLLSSLIANPVVKAGLGAVTLRKCRFLAVSAGTGSFVVGASVPGFVLPITAGAQNLTYNYVATSGNDWEVGDGLYNTTTLTLARTSIVASSNSGNKVSFANPPVVTMTNATTDSPPLGFLRHTVFTGAGAKTWTKGTLTRFLLVFLTGGGGASGASNGGGSASGAGGGAVTAVSYLDVTNVPSYPMVIAGSAQNSTLNTNLMVAPPGGNSSATGLDGFTGGGGGGSGGTGDFLIPGTPGGPGEVAGSQATPGVSFFGSYGMGGFGAGGGAGGNVGNAGVGWFLEFGG